MRKPTVLFHGPSWLYGCITVATHAGKLDPAWLLLIPVHILLTFLLDFRRQLRSES